MKKKILLIDDEAEIRDLLTQVLTREGYQVSSAGCGADAKRMVETGAPDLIISDLQMEDTDGLSLVSRFKETLPDTPIILLTGVIFDPETINETINKKGLVYIVKTASLQRIRDEVKRLLA
jgi:DNA-binding NtrC family response regulator